ncbi:MAG: ABC transporter ATP-binding protein [Burkholderiales bacterium]|nr:ABC transporter ATP-binding protein [Burkholderiales bacterium]
MSYAVQFESVSRAFGETQALNHVSFSVESGEFFGLLGPNGAGKTTLISILAGLIRSDRGLARVMGFDAATHPMQARMNLGVVPQEIVYDPFFTVRETLRFQAGYFGLMRADDWIDEVLSHLGLIDKARLNMRALSGGMRRRVLVAQALVHKPPVIVLDEPTAGVDVESRHALWAFISRLNAEGHTILLTTHYLEEAQKLCGRIAMLKKGNVVALDHTDNLLKRFSQSLTVRLKAPRLPLAWASRALPLPSSDAVQITLDRYEDIEALIAAFRQENIPIDRFSTEEADLEDVFLRLTGDTDDKAAPPAATKEHHA